MRRFGALLRPMFLGAGVATLVSLGAQATRAEPPPADVKPTKTRTLAPKERTDLLIALKGYLDPNGDTGQRRLDLQGVLASLKGYDLLADMDALTGLVYQARPFPEQPIAKRHLPKDVEFNQVGTTVSLNVRDPLMRFSLALPKSYVPQADAKKLIDRPPTPLIVTLHERQDYQGKTAVNKFPGEEILKRRYDPAGPSKAVLEEWALLAPVSTQAKWVGEDGVALVKDLLALPMRETWTRYHVDFDRMVIDGGSEALLIAAARPYLFSGVIVRGDQADVAPEIVKNFAHLQGYVVGTAASAAAKTLAANGFPAARLKVGGPEGLAEWLKSVKRTIPKSFHWTMKDRDMAVANWININSAESGLGVTPTLDVEVADTTEEPNTIKIKSKSVRGIALLLNDRIVDLDRPLRLIVNGHPVTSAQIPEGSAVRDVKLPAKLDRSPDTAFLAKPLQVRKNLFYGMLFPVIVDGIKINSDDTGEAPPPAPAGPPADPKPGDGAKPGPDARPAGTGSPPAGTGAAPAAPGAAPVAPGVAPEAPPTPEENEASAKRKFEKAEGYEKEGDLATAMKLYKQIVGLGTTTFKDRAEAKVKELEAKGSTPK